MRIAAYLAVICCLVAAAWPAPAQPAPATPAAVKGAHFPALSPDGRQVCFEYRGDLWVADVAGGAARRLTVHPAYDGWPRWSPDGNWIAFSSNREGNYDVYLVPARGGSARRLTFDSADDYVSDWSPDGSQVLFGSAREGRYPDLYMVHVVTDRVRRLTRDEAPLRYGAVSPDGKRVAYTRGGQPYWRPKYRGSTAGQICVAWTTDGSARELTDNKTWDGWPLWSADGKALYFVSARDGWMNVWRMEPDGSRPVELTHYKSEAIRFPTIARNGSTLVYERGADLCSLDLAAPGAAPKPIPLVATNELVENQVDRVTLSQGASRAALSRDSKTLAFTLRGDVWACPVAGGDATQLTKTDAAEYSPDWSPDGSRLAYVSDRDGNLEVYTMDVKTKAEQRVTTTTADEMLPRYSPNGRLLAYVRSGGADPGLYVQPLPQGAPTAAPRADFWKPVCAGPGTVAEYAWSADSRWLAYERRDATGTVDIWVVPAFGGTPVNVTRYPGRNTSPEWTRDGKSLIFLSTRGSSASSPVDNIYRLPLRAGEDDQDTKPAAGRPGRPTGDEAQDQPAAPSGGATPARPPGGPPSPPATPVRIDFDGIEDRAEALTNTRDDVGSFAVLSDSRTILFTMAVLGQPGWWALDDRSGAMRRLTAGPEFGDVIGVDMATGKIYFMGPGGSILTIARTPEGGQLSRVAFSATVRIDEAAQTREAFNEAWRNLRTRFYDPAMHGVDWNALRAKYQALLPDTVNSQDLALLLSQMIGELNASHTGAAPADPPGPRPVTGYLGLGYDESYQGPGLKVADVLPKGPADQPGKRIEVGEYVLAIAGTDVTGNEQAAYLLQDMAGKEVDVLVNARPGRDGARTVRLKPVAKQAIDDLRYDRWVAEERRKVEQAGHGQVAYIHIRQMTPAYLEQFQRELFGDAQSKQALVLDVRFNPGGRIHDDLLAMLARRPHAYEQPRDTERSTQPFQLWDRPVVLLINQYSASDSEILANAFRELGLGTIVGTTTAGAVIGTYDITLVDGTRFRIPHTAWRSLAGKELENAGCEPDVSVAQTPADNAADRDRQLARAVELAVRAIGTPTRD